MRSMYGILGTISAFAFRHRETKKTQCRGGRSQDRLASNWGGGFNATPRPLYPRERPGSHCIGSWVGPKAGLYECGKSRPQRDSIPFHLGRKFKFKPNLH